MITFSEYCEMMTDEGLWLNDKNAIVGLSKTTPPSSPKKTKPAPISKVNPVSPPAPSKNVGKIQAKPASEFQLPDAITCLDRLGISLVEPDRDQMRRIVDRAKKRAMIPTPQAPTPPGHIPPGLQYDPQCGQRDQRPIRPGTCS